MQENTCSCSCFGPFQPKNAEVVYAQVPFLATQARIRYRQFLYNRHWYSRRTRHNYVGVKNNKNTCSCSCFGLFWRKRFGIIRAQVPFLATQARIRYRQFLSIARIYSRRTSQNHVGVKRQEIHVTVFLSVYCGQKDLE